MTLSMWRGTLKKAAARWHLHRSLSLYNSSHGYNEDAIKRKLAAFSGGSVNLCKREDGIAELCISNPARMNAFTGTMMTELAERIGDLESWEEGKGLILYGAENTFCSGSDLKAVKAISNPQGNCATKEFFEGLIPERLAHYNKLGKLFATKEYIEGLVLENCGHINKPGTNRKPEVLFPRGIRGRLVFAWTRLPLISVALVQGKALGGGAELCTACDFRLMTEGSEIRFVHKHMGLVPGWGGATRLIQLIGNRHALKLLSSALRVHPEHASLIGLADAVLSSGANGALEESRRWLSSYTNGPADVNRAIKKVIVSGRERLIEDALRTEKDIFGTVWGGPANLQALSRGTKHN